MKTPTLIVAFSLTVFSLLVSADNIDHSVSEAHLIVNDLQQMLRDDLAVGQIESGLERAENLLVEDGKLKTAHLFSIARVFVAGSATTAQLHACLDYLAFTIADVRNRSTSGDLKNWSRKKDSGSGVESHIGENDYEQLTNGCSNGGTQAFKMKWIKCEIGSFVPYNGSCCTGFGCGLLGARRCHGIKKSCENLGGTTTGHDCPNWPSC